MTDPWIDRPIRSQAEDELGRRAYAVHAAKRIREGHTWDDSIVYSLAGAWGAGKTSMLAMIVEEVRKDSQWRIAEFTPWATSDVTGLLGDFFASLAAALPADRGRQVREVLGEIVQQAAPAGHTVPHAGGVVTGAAKRVGAALKAPRPWRELFDRAMAAVRALDTPVLVVVDDVDRLQTDELAELLKVVRLLGRFGGIHYLLAYDEATLFATLARAGLVRDDNGGAHRFMEKIVQYPLVVPELTSYQLLRRLELGINEALAADQRPALAGDRVKELNDQFRVLLPTPRAVDRYLAQLRHHLPLLTAGEVNEEDFVVLTLLRVAFPLLYDELPRWRAQLTSGHTGELDEDRGAEIRMKPFDPIPLLGAVSVGLQAEAAVLLRDLFPALPTRGVRFTQAPRARAISHERYFDRYFTMGVPDHDMADAVVARALDCATRGDGAELTALLTAADPERAALALEKASGLSEARELADSARLALLRLLLPLLDRWPELQDLFTSGHRNVMRWCVSLLSGLTDAADETELAAIVGTAPGFEDRTELLYRAVRTGERTLPAPATAVLRQVADEAARRLAYQIALQDTAPEDEEVGWLITFLSETNMGSAAQRHIGDGLREGLFGIADVAARFVSIDDISGRPRLARSRREEFAALVPIEEDQWYGQPIDSDVDPEDVSWANRRRGAVGRFP